MIEFIRLLIFILNQYTEHINPPDKIGEVTEVGSLDMLAAMGCRILLAINPLTQGAICQFMFGKTRFELDKNKKIDKIDFLKNLD